VLPSWNKYNLALDMPRLDGRMSRRGFAKCEMGDGQNFKVPRSGQREQLRQIAAQTLPRNQGEEREAFERLVLVEHLIDVVRIKCKAPERRKTSSPQSARAFREVLVNSPRTVS
jgi:hypothetical protein